MKEVKRSGTLHTIPLLIIIFSLSFPSFAQYGGGSGVENDPYLIHTAEQMNAIGARVNDWDKHFKLVADIDLSAYAGTFKIIGCYHPFKPFTGVFDGNGHTISRFIYTSQGKREIGLFRYVTNPKAEIKNLILTDCQLDITASKYAGVLVGQLGSGTVRNCHIRTCTITGNDTVGGMVGFTIYSLVPGNVIDCSVEDVNVTGTSSVGGLVGLNCGTVAGCYSTGTVTGGDNVGGLVGRNGGPVINCYSTCVVIGDENFGDENIKGENIGGLVGVNTHLGNICNCYTIGHVEGNSAVGALLGLNETIDLFGTYFSGEIAACFRNIEVTAELPVIGAGTTDGIVSESTAHLQDELTFRSAGWDFIGDTAPSDDWAMPETGGYPILWWQLDESQWPSLPTFSGGFGTAQLPYLIADSNDLNAIGHNPRLMDKHFRLMTDIDLTDIPFYTIGNGGYHFTGTFHGGDHAISNLTYISNNIDYVGLFGMIGINGRVERLHLFDATVEAGTGDHVGLLAGGSEGGWVGHCQVAGSVVADDYVGGLIGEDKGGVIIDCSVNASIVGDNRIGGLTGSTKTKSLVENCHVDVSVTSSGSWVGGLIGWNDCSVTACSAYGTVESDGGNVGGLLGENSSSSNSKSIIKGCFADSNVVGSSNTGGLIGKNWAGLVRDSYAHGSVEASYDAGGLVGRNEQWGRINNCYSTTHVKTSFRRGGIVASNLNEIRDCFWDIQTSGIRQMCGAQIGGGSGCDDTAGKDTIDMQMADTFLGAGWDFMDEDQNGTEDIWWIDEGQDYPRLWWELIGN
jgi:hypothetical protein